MPSVVYGPGNREGQAAELPPRPTSAWECIASEIPGMPDSQKRRVAMLMLRVVCAWRLEDIGSLFSLHKGHVCREVERAREEMAETLCQSGIDLMPDIDSYDRSGERLSTAVLVRMTPFEKRVLVQISTAGGRSDSAAARLFMMAGGLREACEMQKEEWSHAVEAA